MARLPWDYVESDPNARPNARQCPTPMPTSNLTPASQRATEAGGCGGIYSQLHTHLKPRVAGFFSCGKVWETWVTLIIPRREYDLGGRDGVSDAETVGQRRLLHRVRSPATNRGQFELPPNDRAQG